MSKSLHIDRPVICSPSRRSAALATVALLLTLAALWLPNFPLLQPTSALQDTKQTTHFLPTLDAPLTVGDIARYQGIIKARQRNDKAEEAHLISQLENTLLVSLLGNGPNRKRVEITSRVKDDGKISVLRDFDTVLARNPLADRLAGDVLLAMDNNGLDEALNVIDTAEIDSDSVTALKGKLAAYLFAHGEYARAYPLLKDSDLVPSHTWLAALCAEHLGDHQSALRLFRQLSEYPNLPIADKAASQYWTYLTQKRLGQNAKAKTNLIKAAEYPRSFYGMLARQALGQSLQIDKGEALDKKELFALPDIQVAAMFAAIGQKDKVEDILTDAFIEANGKFKTQIAQLAAIWSLPTLQMRMGSALKNHGRTADFALYPTPGWKPDDGYNVDPALLYAIARQESKFQARAENPSGAIGVMQLMPKTAHFMARKSIGTVKQAQLSEPVVSMALGQEYIEHLMDQPYIADNLIYVMAAYNAGPGKLLEWKQRAKGTKDPLLFLESISFAETRNYVQQVMVNYWMYSELMGQKSGSLQSLAANHWPVYHAVNLEFAGDIVQVIN